MEIVKINIEYVSDDNVNPYEKVYFHDNGTTKSFIWCQEKISKLIGNTYHEVHYLLICKNF